MGVLSNNRAQIVAGALISASFVSDVYDVLTGNAVEDISISGSLSITGSLIGDLTGTASTASYVGLAQTASYVENAVSSSYSVTSSYANNANISVSSSYAATASYSVVTLIDSASIATTASYAVTASQLSGVQTTIVNIPSASILAMGTTPIELLPALVGGQYYDIDNIKLEFTSGTGYTWGPVNEVYIYGGNIYHQLMPQVFGYDGVMRITGTMNYGALGGVLNVNTTGDALIIGNSNNYNPSNGTGTLRAIITYTVRTFGA